MLLGNIRIRDPYVLTVAEERAYYLFGSTDTDLSGTSATGFDCYRSADLRSWEGPMPAFRPPAGFWSDRQFWAPEVHAYRGRFFLFGSFLGEGRRRGTQVLVADRPGGPYGVWSDGPVTPWEWDCLDGTLHLDDGGRPWLVYCHEWLQVGDGELVAQRLSDDLVRPEGDPLVLFRASEAPWTRPVQDPRIAPDVRAYVTDGPFLHRLPSGVLLLLWSSFGEEGYAIGIARSAGGVEGPWTHQAGPLWRRDGGHGMLARTLSGDLLLTLHQPNRTPLERARFVPVVETADSLRLAPGVEEGGGAA